MQYFGFDRPSFGIKTFGFGSSEFSPLDLFAGGKQGVWYDPSDKSSLFQDVAGTVPVTKDGDPVALMRDKSGNGNHATQTVSTSRPVYKTDGVLHWLFFDGTDDYLDVNVPLIPQPFTKILGFKAPASGGYLMNKGLNGRIYMQPSASTFYISAGVLKSLPYVSGTETVLKTVFSGSNSSVQFDNKVESLSDLGSNPLSAYTLGSAGTSGQAARVDMYGLIILSNAIAADENKIKDVIALKSGVTL